MSYAARVIKSAIESLPLSEQAEWRQAFNQHLLSGGAEAHDLCEGLEVGQVVRGVTAEGNDFEGIVYKVNPTEYTKDVCAVVHVAEYKGDQLNVSRESVKLIQASSKPRKDIFAQFGAWYFEDARFTEFVETFNK